MLVDDTIAAIATPPGEGAIAIIRVSGPEALKVAETVFRGKKTPLSERTLHFGRFCDGDTTVDEGLIAIFRGPRSYTGEDMAEIYCHGGTLVAARVLEAVLHAGARAAEAGEFTRRAFINGKMDLTQAEAVMDVIRASTPRALRAAEEQLSGRLGEEIEKIRTTLLATVAHLEAYIDFPEEGIAPHVGQQLQGEIKAARQAIMSLLATADEGRVLREGVRLVLCGAPNAGKSSLLNRLLGFDRAIVSEIPGTTRDTIEEFASLHGLPFRITDTAGLRETEDQVEREGVARTRKAMAGADIIVRVVDVTRAGDLSAEEHEILVLNKIDLPHPVSDAQPAIRVSSLTGEGINELVDAIVERAGASHAEESPTLAAINARHQSCLERAGAALQLAADELASEAAPELVAVHLRAALDAIGEVIGNADIEEILGVIFSTFCIGK